MHGVQCTLFILFQPPGCCSRRADDNILIILPLIKGSVFGRGSQARKASYAIERHSVIGLQHGLPQVINDLLPLAHSGSGLR